MNEFQILSGYRIYAEKGVAFSEIVNTIGVSIKNISDKECQGKATVLMTKTVQNSESKSNS